MDPMFVQISGIPFKMSFVDPHLDVWLNFGHGWNVLVEGLGYTGYISWHTKIAIFLAVKYMFPYVLHVFILRSWIWDSCKYYEFNVS